jgi:hypothetical protein
MWGMGKVRERERKGRIVEGGWAVYWKGEGELELE